MNYKEIDLYQEIELLCGAQKIGEAEISIKDKMLSRFVIYEPYQRRGYGTQAVKDLCERYHLKTLWVEANNDVAIHVYKKCGFKMCEPTMYMMERSEEPNDS